MAWCYGLPFKFIQIGFRCQSMNRSERRAVETMPSVWVHHQHNAEVTVWRAVYSIFCNIEWLELSSKIQCMLSSGLGNRIISIIDWQAEDIHISFEKKPKQINQDSCLHSHIDKCDEFRYIARQCKDDRTNLIHFIAITLFLSNSKQERISTILPYGSVERRPIFNSVNLDISTKNKWTRCK